MKTMPSLKDSILLLFHHMLLRFDGARFSDLDVCYQFVFTDIENGFPVHITFSKGRAAYAAGRSDSPSITITTPAALWLDISGGIRNPVWALVTGRFTATGQRSLLRLLPNLLTKKVEVPEAPAASNMRTGVSRVLAMVGNPRKKNGLTYFYLQPILDGMRQAGATVEEVLLYERKINPCLGCFQCWTRTPGSCIQKDDQAELLEMMGMTDLILYAMPLYYHSMPGLVKNHFDRQLPLMHPYMERAGGITRHPRRRPADHSVALFSVCGFPELEQFGPLVKTMETYAELGNVRLSTSVLLPGAMKLYYDPTNRSRLLNTMERLQSAGEQLVRTGSVDRKTLKAIGSVPSGLDKWRSDSNWYWKNEMNRTSSTSS